MNLEESDSFRDEIEKNTRKRRGVMLSIVLCAFLVVLLFIMIAMIRHQDAITEKLFIDKQQKKLTSTFYKDIDGNTYVNIEEMAALLGYEYRKGNYGLYDEDEESCYMTNSFEILAVSANSDKFTKYLEVSVGATLADITVTQKSPAGYAESFKLEKPIKYEDGTLYAPLEYIPEMFNVQIEWEQYRKRIYTLNYVVTNIKGSLGSLGITEISGYYENIRAMLYGYIIMGNGTDGTTGNLYGVYSLADNNQILTLQYKDIKFIQNSREFYITTDNGKMGLVDEKGTTIIKPTEYDEISLLDEDNQLYLVRKDNEYGVLNRQGKVIVYVENDEIGYDTSEYTLETISNDKLLFGKCIPVEKDKKYGLYNVDGDVVLSVLYDSFGYKSKSSSRTSGNEESVLIIPSSVGINGIVINQGDLYGIYDVNEEKIALPCVFTKIYAVRKSGKVTYYAEFDGVTYDLKEYLEELGLANIKDDDENTVNANENEDVETENEDTNSSNNNEESSIVEIN